MEMNRLTLKELELEHLADAASVLEGLDRIFTPPADEFRMNRLKRGFEREIEITQRIIAADSGALFSA
jgi:hypothetical protein